MSCTSTNYRSCFTLPAAILLCAACSVLGGCGDSPDGPNVLLIVVDTLRSDRCSCYGYERPTTPFLDNLASQGVRFDSTYCPMPTTGPAHSTLFTSQYPIVHGVTKNGFTLPGNVTTLAESFQNRGYETAAFVSSFAVNHKFGYSQGFGIYDDDFRGANSSFRAKGIHQPGDQGYFDRRANETTDKALAWLRGRESDRPFFLWLHYFDPHYPYDPPALFREEVAAQGPPYKGHPKKRSIDQSYDGEVLFTDREIERFIRTMDRLHPAEETLVVLTSDHGEGLLEHAWLEHGFYLFEEAMRIPLIMRYPGRIPAGKVVGGNVELMDVAPTILELTGAEDPIPRSQGRSLTSLIDGKGMARREREIFLQRRFYESDTVSGKPVKGEKYAVISGKWKYIEARDEGTQELFDMEQDPREKKNLAADFPEKVGELSAVLQKIVRNLSDQASSANQSVSDEDAERLRSIGYSK